MPRAGPAVAALSVLFSTVALVFLLFYWPAPFDDAGAWATRLAAAVACGLAAAVSVWRVAAYPKPRGGTSNGDTPPTS